MLEKVQFNIEVLIVRAETGVAIGDCKKSNQATEKQRPGNYEIN